MPGVGTAAAGARADAERPRSPDGGPVSPGAGAEGNAVPLREKKRGTKGGPRRKRTRNFFFFRCPVLFERGRGTSLPQMRIHIHENADK